MTESLMILIESTSPHSLWRFFLSICVLNIPFPLPNDIPKKEIQNVRIPIEPYRNNNMRNFT